MLKWPERARAAISKLFEPLQDIDVYVEDTNDEAFYRCLLNTATNGEVKIARVFALGGKQAVIDAANNHDQKVRRALFIIDGDLSWVKGESTPAILGLHCHNAYCVENIILCEKALSLVLSQDAILTEKQASVMLDYDKWIQTIRTPLLELFSAFATVHDIDPSITTVAQGVGVMCTKRQSSGKHELDPVKVHKARDKALKVAEDTAGNAAAVKKKYKQLLQRLRALPNPLHAVSGKDFLFPLINFHLQSFGCRIKKKSLRIRLASAGDIARFAPLATALRQVAKGYV